MHHNDVTERSLFSLSWPIFIDLLLHFSTLLINTYMVSQVSTSYLAAMGPGNLVFDLCITIFSFISVGCSVVIAQYLGARQPEVAKKAIHVSIAFNFVIGLFCAAMLFFFGNFALEAMNMPPHLMKDGFNYLHIIGICLIPEAVSLILAACLRVYGKSKVAMYVTLIVNAITIVGNIFALYVFDAGLVGVRVVDGVRAGDLHYPAACLLNYGLRIRLEFRQFFHWSKDLLGKILYIGLPAAGENLLWMLHYMTANAFIGLMGETALAAQTLYFQIALFVMMFGIAVSIGNEIFVGHLVGAKRFEDAYRRTFKSLRFGIIATIVVVVLFWLFDKKHHGPAGERSGYDSTCCCRCLSCLSSLSRGEPSTS
ncbi:multidrug efflux protein [Leminorella grimontii]|nr:MATE family efflux transporter [Leminorella grimontii]VFS54564.1 multidrug efflux protein [Leminorella grimontii]